MISSPRKPSEKDDLEEVHLVLLDNGRSNAGVERLQPQGNIH